jgi:hypothetical protein
MARLYDAIAKLALRRERDVDGGRTAVQRGRRGGAPAMEA